MKITRKFQGLVSEEMRRLVAIVRNDPQNHVKTSRMCRGLAFLMDTLGADVQASYWRAEAKKAAKWAAILKYDEVANS